MHSGIIKIYERSRYQRKGAGALEKDNPPVSEVASFADGTFHRGGGISSDDTIRNPQPDGYLRPPQILF